MTDRPATFDWGVVITLSDTRQPNGQLCGEIMICDQSGEIVNWRREGNSVCFESRALRNSWMDDFVRAKVTS